MRVAPFLSAGFCHMRGMLGGNLPVGAGARAVIQTAVEPSAKPCVYLYHIANNARSIKGLIPCPSKQFFSPLLRPLALLHAVTHWANKRSAVVSWVPVQQPSQAVASRKARPSVPALTYWRAKPAQCAANNLTSAAASGRGSCIAKDFAPLSRVLMRGFSVHSRPKGTVDVQ